MTWDGLSRVPFESRTSQAAIKIYLDKNFSKKFIKQGVHPVHPFHIWLKHWVVVGVVVWDV